METSDMWKKGGGGGVKGPFSCQWETLGIFDDQSIFDCNYDVDCTGSPTSQNIFWYLFYETSSIFESFGHEYILPRAGLAFGPLGQQADVLVFVSSSCEF